MKTKVISLILVFALAFSCNVSAFAQTTAKPSGDIHLNFINTEDVTSILSFNGTCADCAAVVNAKDGTTKIVMTGVLKRVTANGTTTIKSWTQTVYGASLDFEKNWYVSSGYEYQFEVVAKVYRSGNVETVRVTDSEYCG